MNREEFIVALELELQLRHVPFDLGELLTFAADVWPLAAEDPDPRRWADAFLVGLVA